MLASLSGVPKSEHPYQTLGDLRIYMKHGWTAEDYTRELDIANAVYKCSYRIGETVYTREAFISAPDDCLVVKITADGPDKISFDCDISREPYETDIKKTGSGADWDYTDEKLQKTHGLICMGNTGGGGVDY